MQYDVIIIGGSYSGAAAALQLARARRRTLVIDAGRRRNRFTQRSHGFLTRDGADALAIAKIAREQLQVYESISWLEGTVTDIERNGKGFKVRTEEGASLEAKRIVFATGVIDVLPQVPGLSERWGHHVFHCPYCHGYELDQREIGVLATSSHSMHQALMLPDWGPTTFLLNGTFTPDKEQLDQLHKRGVSIEYSPIERIDADMDIRLQDGRTLSLAGLFVLTRTDLPDSLAEQLGCELEEEATGRFIKTDSTKATTVRGVFACGDVIKSGGSVAISVADGSIAGCAVQQSLITGLG